MNKLILIGGIFAASFTSMAFADKYPQNPIERPLTLNEGTVQVLGAFSYGREQNDDISRKLGANISYGLTDNLQIGLEGLTYSFLNNKNDDLDIAINAGIRGFVEHDGQDVRDHYGLGTSIFGKKVINKDLALTFGFGYTYWKEEVLENRSEFDYSVGVMTNVAEDLTLSANYTFRDLKDFQQSNAKIIDLGLNYAVSSRFDLGLVLAYSDFKEQDNNVYIHEIPEKSASIYAAWRF